MSNDDIFIDDKKAFSIIQHAIKNKFFCCQTRKNFFSFDSSFFNSSFANLLLFFVNFYWNHLTLLPSQCGLPWINTIKILSIRHLRLHQTFFKLVENQFTYMQVIIYKCDWYFCYLSKGIMNNKNPTYF